MERALIHLSLAQKVSSLSAGDSSKIATSLILFLEIDTHCTYLQISVVNWVLFYKWLKSELKNQNIKTLKTHAYKKYNRAIRKLAEVVKTI